VLLIKLLNFHLVDLSVLQVTLCGEAEEE
jgi:hypothetical protein